jgi:hypothetical protein
MRYNARFHPEWGYLAPAPSFIRTVRIVFIATAVGAAVGAGALVTLLLTSHSNAASDMVCIPSIEHIPRVVFRDSDTSYKAKQPWEWAKGSPAIKDVKAILRD